MDDICGAIAKDASDRFALMIDEAKKESLEWAKNQMDNMSKKENLDWIQKGVKRRKRFLEQTIDVLIMIYGEDIDQKEIQDIVLKQFSSAIHVLANELEDSLKCLN